MIVRVVGNFGGPKALRAVGAYLRQKETVVSAFYTSNVEQYLREDGTWDNFCASAATLPVDATSIFIRSERGGFRGHPTSELSLLRVDSPRSCFDEDGPRTLLPEVRRCWADLSCDSLAKGALIGVIAVHGNPL